MAQTSRDTTQNTPFARHLVPYKHRTLNVGTSDLEFDQGRFRDLVADTVTITTLAGGSLTLTDQLTLADGSAAAPAVRFTNETDSGLALVSGTMRVVVNAASRLTFSQGAAGPTTNGAYNLGSQNVGWGALYLDYTNTATIGAVTISKASGRANIALGASSVVVTNTLCTAAAHVFASLNGNDVTALYIRSVIPAAGSFTIHTTANATADTAVNWVVISAD